MAVPTRLIGSIAALSSAVLVKVRPKRDPRLRIPSAPVTPPLTSGVSRPERY